jgi:hypothetical protein
MKHAKLLQVFLELWAVKSTVHSLRTKVSHQHVKGEELPMAIHITAVEFP